MMSEALVARIRYHIQKANFMGLKDAESTLLLGEAADAIEELSMKLHGDEAAIFGMKREIERMVVADKPRWIPVTERLPKEWWPVLGLIQFHDEEEPPAQQVLWFLGNGHWRETWRGDMIESSVTHWMPLPEPPEEKTC